MQRARIERLNQFRLQLPADQRLALHLVAIGLEMADPHSPGTRQGQIGAGEHGLGTGLALEQGRKAQAGGAAYQGGAQLIGLGQRLGDARGQAQGLALTADALQQREFIATHARQHVTRPDQPSEPAHHCLQQHIAHRLAMGVVDRAETIQIDHMQGEAGDRPSGQPGDQFGLEAQAIGQFGQRVMLDEVADPLLRLAGLGDVDAGAQDLVELPRRIEQGDGADQQLTSLTGAVDALTLDGLRGRMAVAHGAQFGLQLRRQAGAAGMQADQRLFIEAEEILRGTIGIDETQIGVEGRDQRGQIIHQGAQGAMGGAQLGLGQAGLGEGAPGLPAGEDEARHQRGIAGQQQHEAEGEEQ